MTRGIPLELLARMGVCKTTDQVIHPHNVTIDSIERFKIVADQLLQTEPNLQFLYYTPVVDAVVEGDRIVEAVLGTKAGLRRIQASTVIDATGDADVAAWSGVPLDGCRDQMPLSLHSRIGNVVLKSEVGNLVQEPDLDHPGLSHGEVDSKQFAEILQRAHDEGRIGNFYGPLISFRYAPNEAHIQSTRINADATDPEGLTHAEVQGRIDAWAMFELWKQQVPGFENSYFIASGPYAFVRETRRIVGQYVLTEHDVKDERRFPDGVATGCWYMDLHPNFTTAGAGVDWDLRGENVPGMVFHQPSCYDIPYRSLLPLNIVNLLVAGRGHSATRLAASSTRVSATSMAMGQAAGVAAALAVRMGVTVQELDGRKVRELLVEQGIGPYAGPA